MEHLKQRAVLAAKDTRQTAATTAWWLMTSIMVSGFAAVLGGIVDF